MEKINGVVKIYLSPEARLPVWIKRWIEKHLDPDYCSVRLEDFEGSDVRVLKLVGGEASFCYPRDDVIIKLPGQTHPWASGFDPTAVLQITNGDGSVIKQNRLLCPHCHTTTGGVAYNKLGEKPVTVYKCTSCTKEWEY